MKSYKPNVKAEAASGFRESPPASGSPFLVGNKQTEGDGK